MSISGGEDDLRKELVLSIDTARCQDRQAVSDDWPETAASTDPLLSQPDTLSLFERRRAHRRFADQHVRLDTCATLARVAMDEHAGLFREPAAFDIVFYSARWFDGTAGAFAWSMDALLPLPHTTAYFEDAPLEASTAAVGERWQFRAPVTLLFYLNLVRASELWGAAGYPTTLLHIGSALDTVWLAALALGLQGCPFAGVDGGWGRALAPGIGHSDRAILGLALGYSADGGAQ